MNTDIGFCDRVAADGNLSALGTGKYFELYTWTEGMHTKRYIVRRDRL